MSPSTWRMLRRQHLNIGSMACAFDRTNMLIGSPTPNPMQCFGANPNQNGKLYLGHSLVPADVEGTTPPPVGRDEFLVSIQNPPSDGKSITSNTINLWDFHVDWVTPTNSTFTNTPLTVTTYTPGCYTATGIFNTYCAPEPAINPLNNAHFHVDTVGDRLMPRLDYRNFGTYESFLVSHTIRAGKNTNTETGIRWYELRGSGTPRSLSGRDTWLPIRIFIASCRVSLRIRMATPPSAIAYPTHPRIRGSEPLGGTSKELSRPSNSRSRLVKETRRTRMSGATTPA